MRKKIIISFFAFLLILTSVSAESLYPKELVKALIKSVQANQLEQTLRMIDFVKVSNWPRHALNSQEAIEALRSISIADSKLEDIYGNYSDFSWPKKVLVRVYGEVSLDFELSLVAGTPKHQEDHYVVVGIHP